MPEQRHRETGLLDVDSSETTPDPMPEPTPESYGDDTASLLSAETSYILSAETSYLSSAEMSSDGSAEGASLLAAETVAPEFAPTEGLVARASATRMREAAPGERRAQLRSSDRADSGASPRPGDTMGHYELIRELGRGGMGVVFLARDLKLARRVAIKFILARDPGLTERFIAEARTTARCHHENIVIIHDISDHGGNPYMVLEYLRGQNLRDLIGQQPVAPERVVEIILPVARALESAHQHGIIHRDLKPENIHVTDTGQVKVLDFGIAKALSSREGLGRSRDPDASRESSAQIPLPETVRQFETRASALVGTVPYMSPEQLAQSGEIDQRSDLWALGIIFLELLLGRHPLAPLNPSVMRRVADLGEPMPSAAELVPHAGKLGALIDRCLIKNRDDRLATASELVSDLEALAPRHSASVLAAGESPFHGLAAFQKSDADRFFGRSGEIHAVVAQLQSQPLVAVAGPSGTGKSSLVRAGVIPALERSGEGWHSLVIRPGRDPLAALTGLLDELRAHSSTATGFGSSAGSGAGFSTGFTAGSGADGEADSLADRLVQEPGSFGRDLRAWARRKRRRLLLFVDQFEELYTLVGDDDARTVFARCLQGAADDASSPLRVVLSIRSDFLDRLVEAGHFSTELARGLVLLPPMGRDGLRAALTEPVAAAGYRFEEESLVDDMLGALAGTPGALPLLQFAASKLWDGRDRAGKRLTRECYEGFGGVAGALAVHGDAVLAGMSAARLTLARTLFERLVTPDHTRAVVTLGELRELPGDSDTIEQVVHHLADARLIIIEHGSGDSRARTTTSDSASGPDGRDEDGRQRAADTSTVELIHESLITSWPTLRRWLDDSREDAEFLARLRTAAQQWHDGRERDGLLWRGEAAREARRWNQRGGARLTDRERRYLEAVIAHLGRSIRLKRYAVAGVIGFLTILLVVAAVGLLRIREAEKQAIWRADRLGESLQKEAAAKQQAERAQQQAERAREDAEKAEARALEEAENSRKALAEAQAARASAARSAAEAQQAEMEARAAQARADAERAAADAARKRALAAKARTEKERARAEQEARKNQEMIDRAVGPIDEELTR